MVWLFKGNACGWILALIEDITWPRGDMKFLFECWKIFHKGVQWMSEIFFTRREISYLYAAFWCSVYFINTRAIPNLFTLIVFCCERCNLLCSHSKHDLFTCEDNMLFLHVKITCFRRKGHLVFTGGNHWLGIRFCHLQKNYGKEIESKGVQFPCWGAPDKIIRGC